MIVNNFIGWNEKDGENVFFFLNDLVFYECKN